MIPKNIAVLFGWKLRPNMETTFYAPDFHINYNVNFQQAEDFPGNQQNPFNGIPEERADPAQSMYQRGTLAINSTRGNDAGNIWLV